MAGVDDLFAGDDEDKLGFQEYMTSYSDVNTKMYYAKSIAWAVENGVMGNGAALNPASDITRAEVAAMAVNFQPENLANPVI